MYSPQILLASTFLLHFSLTLFSTNAQELRTIRSDASLYNDLISELRKNLKEDARMRFGKRSMNRFQFVPLEEMEEYFRKHHM
ncbi:hypothetical protein GCK32_020831 [Trichostrongylus colubriformis]|uniref:Uncharacterized protein n=1 Tax=Trichostrongylus colubriformis TaxID=6319 RepID=A0AAN8FNG3_TRICO